MMTDVRLLYVTCKDDEEALRIADVLLDEKLIACANIIENVTSVYRWHDEKRNEKESILIAKTRAEKSDAIIGRVKELHSYECPCIVFANIESGNEEYLAWIRRET